MARPGSHLTGRCRHVCRAALVPSLATAASGLWRALTAARAAWIADMTAAIGRLRAVVVLTPPGPTPVWLLAHYLAGDTPDRVVATYVDLVVRNGIRHPGLPVTSPVEALAVPPDSIPTDALFSRPVAPGRAPPPRFAMITDDLGNSITFDLGIPMEYT